MVVKLVDNYYKYFSKLDEKFSYSNYLSLDTDSIFKSSSNQISSYMGINVLIPVKEDCTFYSEYSDYFSQEEIQELKRFIKEEQIDVAKVQSPAKSSSWSINSYSRLFKVDVNGKPAVLTNVHYLDSTVFIGFGEVYSYPWGIHWANVSQSFMNANEYFGKGTELHSVIRKGVEGYITSYFDLAEENKEALYLLTLRYGFAREPFKSRIVEKYGQVMYSSRLTDLFRLQQSPNSEDFYNLSTQTQFLNSSEGYFSSLYRVSDLVKYSWLLKRASGLPSNHTELPITESGLVPLIASMYVKLKDTLNFLLWIEEGGDILVLTRTKNKGFVFQSMRDVIDRPIKGEGVGMFQELIGYYVEMFSPEFVRPVELGLSSTTQLKSFKPSYFENQRPLNRIDEVYMVSKISKELEKNFDTLSYIAYNGVWTRKWIWSLSESTETQYPKDYAGLVCYGFKDGKPVSLWLGDVRSEVARNFLRLSGKHMANPYTGLEFENVTRVGDISILLKSFSLKELFPAPLDPVSVGVDSSGSLFGVRSIFQEAIYLLGKYLIECNFADPYKEKDSKGNSNFLVISFDSVNSIFKVMLYTLNVPPKSSFIFPWSYHDLVKKFYDSEPIQFVIEPQGGGRWKMFHEGSKEEVNLKGRLGRDWDISLIRDRVVACLQFLDKQGYPNLEFSMTAFVVTDFQFLGYGIDPCYVLDMKYSELGKPYLEPHKQTVYLEDLSEFTNYMVNPDNPYEL